MTSLLALELALLGGVQARGDQDTPFSTHFRTADTVLVGVVESGRLIQQSEAGARLALVTEHAPKRLPVPLYPCELRVRVRAIIKTKDPHLEAGSVVPVVWYLLSPACLADYRGETLLGKPALWLLRTENGSLHALVDACGLENTPSVLPIGSFSAETEQKLREWKDPRLAVTYLVLKPGVIVSEKAYQGSWLLGEVAAVAGYSNFLKVYRAVYLESDERMRGLISVEVASYGSCLNAARRVLATEPHGEDLPHSTLLDRPTADGSLDSMWWTTKEQLLKDAGSPTEAVDYLTMLACHTDARVKTRARELLCKYFGIASSTLPCIPCE